jgi:hypothetical protein
MACVPNARADAAAGPAGDLRARYVALSQQLENSSIQRGLYLDSNDDSRAPRGDAYAVVDYPFAMVAAAMAKPENLCESLILHLNVQYCRATPGDSGPRLSAAVGKKTNQPLEDTHRIDFIYEVAASSADYTRVELSSREGPFDTANYLIVLELAALDEQRAFLHLRYSYTQGFLTRWATAAYFATRGRDKVGFTRVHAEGDAPQLVRGIRGALERNTMRYYLAIDAYLHTLGSPSSQRFEQSLERWFADTERFARQLREVKHDDYIAMKRGQYLRQQDVKLPPPRVDRGRASGDLPFLAVKVQFLDHPRLPTFLLRDGDAQMSRFDRRGQIESCMGFAHHMRDNQGPVLSVVGRFDAVSRRPAHILAALTLLAAGIDVDGDDPAARG